MKSISVFSPVRQPIELPSRQHVFLLLVISSCFVLACYVLEWRVGSLGESLPTVPLGNANPTLSSAQVAAVTDDDGRFDGQRAYGYLKQLCEFGSRTSGSPGMLQQQKLLEKHFTDLGGLVRFQKFQMRKHPLTGQPVPMANLVVQWRPESRERILLCAHYDTRPYADRETGRRAKQGVFLGANDGASGVALLMELSHHVRNLPERYGLDFVLFDAEEFVFNERSDQYFLGSKWFARQYRDQPPSHRYVAGVLLDMVGDAKLSIYQERHSVSWKDTRHLVKEIWGTAERLGVKEFIPRPGYPFAIRDDHLPLHNIAKIPVIDIIDFEYPDRSNRYWHTLADAPDRCSADSLGKVGWVIQEWLATKP